MTSRRVATSVSSSASSSRVERHAHLLERDLEVHRRVARGGSSRILGDGVSSNRRQSPPTPRARAPLARPSPRPPRFRVSPSREASRTAPTRASRRPVRPPTRKRHRQRGPAPAVEHLGPHRLPSVGPGRRQKQLRASERHSGRCVVDARSSASSASLASSSKARRAEPGARRGVSSPPLPPPSARRRRPRRTPQPGSQPPAPPSMPRRARTPPEGSRNSGWDMHTAHGCRELRLDGRGPARARRSRGAEPGRRRVASSIRAWCVCGTSSPNGASAAAIDGCATTFSGAMCISRGAGYHRGTGLGRGCVARDRGGPRRRSGTRRGAATPPCVSSRRRVSPSEGSHPSSILYLAPRRARAAAAESAAFGAYAAELQRGRSSRARCVSFRNTTVLRNSSAIPRGARRSGRSPRPRGGANTDVAPLESGVSGRTVRDARPRSSPTAAAVSWRFPRRRAPVTREK